MDNNLFERRSSGPGLARTSTSCAPLWRISDDFNAPKVKSISQIH